MCSPNERAKGALYLVKCADCGVAPGLRHSPHPLAERLSVTLQSAHWTRHRACPYTALERLIWEQVFPFLSADRTPPHSWVGRCRRAWVAGGTDVVTTRELVRHKHQLLTHTADGLDFPGEFHAVRGQLVSEMQGKRHWSVPLVQERNVKHARTIEGLGRGRCQRHDSPKRSIGLWWYTLHLCELEHGAPGGKTGPKNLGEGPNAKEKCMIQTCALQAGARAI